ncbi:MAG: WYL domain-containing transcriptional regulator [Planctomycetaceae bacterium]|nr:WYL domain-containing transcriptional regulator [Planctomycetaceae bacterium]
MPALPPIERHWLLLRTLSARKPGCSVCELAAEFRVNEKTIRRDLGQLKRLGFPLEERAEEHGRKRWRVRTLKGCPGLSFDLTEILSLFLARRLLEPLAGSYFWDGAQSAFRKVRATLGHDAVRYLDRLGGMIHDPHQRTSDYRDHGDIIDGLMIGIEDRSFTFITYQSAKATEPLTYDVHPYGLVHHRGSLYLVADSQQHGEFRVFKVDRISDVAVEPLKFEKKAFDLKAFFDASFGVWKEDVEPMKVVVRFAASVARYIEEHHWPGCERKTLTAEGALLCEFRLAGLQEFKSWIMSFGAKAVVLEPQVLVEAIRDEAVALSCCYQAHADDAESRLDGPAARAVCARKPR